LSELGLTVTQESVSSAAAQRIIDAAVGHAHELGFAATVAVVDQSATLKAFCRADGAVLASVTLAQRKAVTAATTGAPTAVAGAAMADSVLRLTATHSVEGWILLGGGVPIRVGEQVIGAVGVSGGDQASDIEVAEGAVAAVFGSRA
jgi:glc operon protein GlcG